MKIIGFCWGENLAAQRKKLVRLADWIGGELVEVFSQHDVGRHSKWQELEAAIYATKTAEQEHGQAILVISTLSGRRKGINRNITFLKMLEWAKEKMAIDAFVIADDATSSLEEIELREVVKLPQRAVKAIVDAQAQLGAGAVKDALAKAQAWVAAESERRKAEMAERKARGVLIGAQNPAAQNLTDKDRKAGSDATKQKAINAYADIVETIHNLRAEGQTFREIAERLNKEGRQTSTGKRFSHVQVLRIYKRKGEE